MAKSKTAKRPRERARIPKEKRQNLRLWAEGAREKILLPHLDKYAQERDMGWAKERAYLQKVCNEYHARIDWKTEDYEEPELKAYDPQELVEHPTLSDEEEILKRRRIKLLNGRIRRWFVYRIRRRRNMVSGLDPRKDPFALLLSKLTGLTAPPKARQAFQQFMHESYAEKIAPIVSSKWADARANNEPCTVGKKEPKAGFRAQVAREVFAALPAAEKTAIAQRAKDEAAAAKAKYEADLKGPPSNKPADRQRCIDALPEFLEPIFRGVQELTGLHSMVIVGGPIPKFDGDLRTVHIAVGRNKAAAPVHSTQWDTERFKRHVVKYMVDYLGTAFNNSDCAASALPSDTNLANAKYTIDDAESPEQSEDDMDLLGSDSGTDDDDDDDDDQEEDAPLPKRRKVVSKQKTQTAGAKRKRPASKDDTSPAPSPSPSRSPSPSPPIDERPDSELTFQEVLERNKRRTAALAEALRADLHDIMDDVRKNKKAPPPAPRARKARQVGPPRRSGRLNGDTDVAAGAGVNDDAGHADISGHGRTSRPTSPSSSVNGSTRRSASSASLGGLSRASTPPPTDGEMDIDDFDVMGSEGGEDTNERMEEEGPPVAKSRDKEAAVTSPPPSSLRPASPLPPPPRTATPPVQLAASPLAPRKTTPPPRTTSPPPQRAASAPPPKTTPPPRTTSLPPSPPQRTAIPPPATGNEASSLPPPPLTASPPPPRKTTPPPRTASLPPSPPQRTAIPPPATGNDASSLPPPLLTASPPPPASTSTATESDARALVPVSEPPVCPAKAPEWFLHARTQLTQVNLGAHFNAVLDAWTRIELACSFANPKHDALPKTGRPKQVDKWITAARGRRRADTLVKNPGQYEQQFWGWWDSLQPKWRSKEVDGSWVVGGAYGKDWDSLSYWGENGLLSVAAALYFWGCAVQYEDGLLERWERAVGDTCWVFEGLALFHEGFKKRR